MSQPQMFPTPHRGRVARGHSQLVTGVFDRTCPSEGEYPVRDVLAGRRDGERTRAVLAPAGVVELVATS